MSVLQSNSAKVAVSIVGGGLIAFLLLAIVISFGASSKRQRAVSTVVINQEKIAVDAGQSITLSASALDREGDIIEDVGLVWAVLDDGSGTVDQTGIFTANTKAGYYPLAIRVSLSSSEEGSSLPEDTRDIWINPGPVFEAIITTESSEIFTGDSMLVKVNGWDIYHNDVTLTGIQWGSNGGNIDDAGLFKAGRTPGEYNIEAFFEDSRTFGQAETTINVKQGRCEIEKASTRWQLTIFDYDPSKDLEGDKLGHRSETKNFDNNWGRDAVYGTQRSNVYINADATIVVQRQGLVRFTVGGDDGYRLSVDGNNIINSWKDHPYDQTTRYAYLTPGPHSLRLEYYERTGNARLKFVTDEDVLEWQVAKDCTGGYSQKLVTRYFLYDAPAESHDQASVADRFDVNFNDADMLSARGNAYLESEYGSLFFVEAGEKADTKIIFLEGLGSSVACPARTRDSLDRRDVLAHLIQTTVESGVGQSSYLDESDIVQLSYSGKYEDCLTGATFTGDTIPTSGYAEIGGQLDSASRISRSVSPTASYSKSDTCTGVIAASQELKALTNRFLGNSPDMNFILIGHSLGGMVAAHFASQQDQEFIDNHLRKVITIDSPLRGRVVPNILFACTSKYSESIADIEGQTRVIADIERISDLPVASKFLHINSTQIGDEIPNVELIQLECEPTSTGEFSLFGAFLGFLVGGPLGAMAGAEAGYLGGSVADTIAGHGCAFSDMLSIERISKEIHQAISDTR
jgi:pimeloyl-ACP methyl ester carboxylesterase